MSLSLLTALTIAQGVAQPRAAPLQPLELRGRIRENLVASEITVGADGIIMKCARTDRPYHNVPAPPDICDAYPVGARYGPPTTFKGKPMRRKVTIRISTYDVNILTPDDD